MKTVIIGNSAAAVGCIEGIRKTDKESEIILIASEKHHTYSRPLISYRLLGKTDAEHMKYRPDSFYEENNVKTMLGCTAEKIDKEAHAVILTDGTRVDYDKLLVATGSSPFIPPIDGLERAKNKFTFMSLDDSFELEKQLTNKSKVLILGAGLIGLKCAEGIKERVSQITVVDLAERVLQSILVDYV